MSLMPGDATPLQGADEGLAAELRDGDSGAIAFVPGDATPLHGADEVLGNDLSDVNAANGADEGLANWRDGDPGAIASVPGDVTPLHVADEVLGDDLLDDNAASDAPPSDCEIDLFATLLDRPAQPKEKKSRRTPLAESDFIAEFLFNARREDVTTILPVTVLRVKVILPML